MNLGKGQILFHTEEHTILSRKQKKSLIYWHSN
jgi:hypothetical protein